MTADELKDRLIKPDKNSETRFEPFYQITPKELKELNEAYHKAKVDSITDEEIEKCNPLGLTNLSKDNKEFINNVLVKNIRQLLK